MRTALFTTIYLDGQDAHGTPRPKRTERWLDWCKYNKELIGYDDLWLIDNGSPPDRVASLLSQRPETHVARFPHMPRLKMDHGYPYCWRGIWFMRALIGMGYDRILFMDNDFFILSKRLMDFTQACKSGWQTLWVEDHGYPAAEFQILNADTFPFFLQWTESGWQQHVGKIMETTLPFTHINKQFRYGRYGERRLAQEPWQDAYGQAPLDIALTTNLS